jgi:hypothetical protein
LLLSKNIRLTEAILNLVSAGLPEEAFGLSRSMAEVAFHLRYIANKSTEARATRFVHFYGKIYKEFATRFRRHFPQYRKHKNPDHVRLYKWARKFPERGSWIRSTKRGKGGAKALALEPDTIEKLKGKGVDWAFDYEFIYFWTSQFVHASIYSLLSHVPEPKAPFELQPNPKEGKRTEGLALFNAGLYLYKSSVSALRILKVEFPASVKRSFDQLLVVPDQSKRPKLPTSNR